MEFTGTLATTLAIGSLLLTAICLLIALANPYRLRRVGQERLASVLPANKQKELFSLADAWAGHIQITPFQIRLLSYAGLIFAILVAVLVSPLVDTLYAIIIGVVLGGLLLYYPRQRFEGGFPKNRVAALEREAPVFAAFMHRAIGITGLSVQMSFEQFLEVYPEKETAKLLARVPEGISYPDAILGLGLPVTKLQNWIQIIQVIGSISEFGEPESILKEMRDRIRKREEQYLRMMIKRKAFAAPAATVAIMLPGLMCVLIGSVLLQAIRTLTGGF